MPSPSDLEELTQALAEAEELARQRALALELRDMRQRHSRELELEAARQRARRVADLLHLEEVLSESGVAQIDYVLRPKVTEREGEGAPEEAQPTETSSS